MTDTLSRTILLVVLVQGIFCAQARGQGSEGSGELAPDIAPTPAPIVQTAPEGVNWSGLFRSSFAFLVLEEGFRAVTEEGARHPHEPFFQGWGSSIDGLHGWADGDPFLVNYVGHPMQGAVSGYLWIQNDRRYRTTEFGRNRMYWKSRLRAGAYAWAYSVMEELGPLSEATVGATQSKYPQQGFVDHVITPAIGLGWIIAEDFVDRYIIKKIDEKIGNPYLSVFVRGGLNPSRSFANMLSGHVPWDRATRAGLFSRARQSYVRTEPESFAVRNKKPASDEVPRVPPFELSTIALIQQDSAATGPCIGGGANAAVRVAAQWQVALEVGGCKMTGMRENQSGDSLHYMAGTRWTPSPNARWSPFAQVLVGGQKLTIEDVDPVAQNALENALRASGNTIGDSDHGLYSSEHASNGFAFKVGGGLNLKLNSALGVRVVGVDYMYSGIRDLDGIRHGQGLQVTGGLVLRMGTW